MTLTDPDVDRTAANVAWDLAPLLDERESADAVFRLVALETLILSLVGGALGLLLAAAGGRWVEAAVRGFIPLAPAHSLLSLTGDVVARCLLLGVGAGLLAGAYPAWRASRLAPAEALRLQS